MPLCQGCGASYDDNYKFCPHCGRAKPELEAININAQVAPVRYEEVVLKIEVVGTAELTEPPFDWRPSGMTKLLGEAGKNWTHITKFRLLLNSFHRQRGQYVAHQSTEFRGYVVQLGYDVKSPDRFRRDHLFRSWADDLFQERRRTWESINNYLLREGWSSLTEQAVQRKVPSCLEDASYYRGEPDLFDVAYLLRVYLPPNPPVGTTKELDDYRYRRVAG